MRVYGLVPYDESSFDRVIMSFTRGIEKILVD